MEKEVILNQSLKNDNRPSKINTIISPRYSIFSPNNISTPPPKSSKGTYYWKYYATKRESKVLNKRDKNFNKILKNIDNKMTRIELYFEEIDRRIRSGIPFTPPSSLSSSRSSSLSNSESDKFVSSSDDKNISSPITIKEEKLWREVN